jgi:hypothetical protein
MVVEMAGQAYAPLAALIAINFLKTPKILGI